MAEDRDNLFKDFDKFKKGGEKEDKARMDEKEIVIRINPRMLERVVYWIVILALIALVLFNPLSDMIKGGCITTTEGGETVQAGGAVITDVEETGEEKPIEDTIQEEKKAEQTQQPPISLSGQISMVITSVITEKDEDGNPNKITEVRFSIENQKEDFRPKVEVYWYDETDMSGVKTNKRGGATFPTLFAGAGKDYKLTRFNSKYITDYHEGETVYIKLYNGDKGTFIMEESKLIE